MVKLGQWMVIEIEGKYCLIFFKEKPLCCMYDGWEIFKNKVVLRNKDGEKFKCFYCWGILEEYFF